MYNFAVEVTAMLYRLYPKTDEVRIFTEPRSRCRLPFRTVKEMRARYPSENFVIIGEIGSFARPPTAGDQLLTGDGQALPILPRGSLKWPFEWITGYIPVRENTYLALVKSMLPAFLR